MRRRNLVGIALGALFAAMAMYWLVLGRREIEHDELFVEETPAA